MFICVETALFKVRLDCRLVHEMNKGANISIHLQDQCLYA